MAVVFELQVDALKKEFEECKSQDASKYELIDVGIITEISFVI